MLNDCFFVNDITLPELAISQAYSIGVPNTQWLDFEQSALIDRSPIAFNTSE